MGIDQTVEPLHYKRTRVVEMLQEHRDIRRTKREEEKAKRLARNANVVQGIRASLDNERFVVFLVEQITYGFGIKSYFGGDPFSPVENPDADIDALIRLYENASDEEVTIAQTEPVYKYLTIPE